MDRVPGRQQCERNQERREDDEPQAQAINRDVIAHPQVERIDPLDVRFKLKARAFIETDRQRERDKERREREEKCCPFEDVFVGFVARPD